MKDRVYDTDKDNRIIKHGVYGLERLSNGIAVVELNKLYNENIELSGKNRVLDEKVRMGTIKMNYYKEKMDEYSETIKQLNRDRARLINYMRRELDYDVTDEIRTILCNEFYDSVWWDEDNEDITPENIEKAYLKELEGEREFWDSLSEEECEEYIFFY